MKKFFTSIVFILVFAAYGLHQYFGNSTTISYVASSAASSTQPADTKTVAQSSSPFGPPFTQTPSPTPTPTTKVTPPTKTSPVSLPTPVSPPPPTPTPIPTPVSTPAPAPKPQGQYTDGTYTGSVADAYYGNVQVQVTVSGGKMTDVAFLQYPNDRNTSRRINNQAMSMLSSEAIQAQNAQVDGVSGASDTTSAFRESLTAALSQARS